MFLVVFSFSFFFTLLAGNFGVLNALVALPTPVFPAVILPGFGNDLIDYINPLQFGEENGFVSALRRRNIDAEVVPITRSDWLKLAGGIFKREFWSYDCKPDSLYGFYYEKVTSKVLEVHERTGKPVMLIGHSAGGWLARGVLGEGKCWGERIDLASSDVVIGLCTLGTPHTHPVERSFDVTRGCLRYINGMFPGSFLSKENICYASVAGTAIEGDPTADWNSPPSLAHQSYKQVVGVSTDTQYIGDAVVPLVSAHLDGALQITLDGVFHSITAPELSWYGGERVIDMWLPQFIELCAKTYVDRRQI